MNQFTRTVLVSSLFFAFAQAASAQTGTWHQVQEGVIERFNADGSISRATYGPAGARFTYDRLLTRIAEIEASKAGLLESLSELQSLYASLGVAASARLTPPNPNATNDDWRNEKKVGAVVNAADYTDTICGNHKGEFWSTYSSNVSTASLVVTAKLSYGGFSPPPPPITQWSVPTNASFLTTSGGTWNQVNEDDYNPSGDKTSTAVNSASRAGYCDGYSLGQISVFCPAGGGDYSSYEQFYNGCP